jgi:hypothetical protein
MKSYIEKTIVCLAAACAGFAAVSPAMGKQQWEVPLGGIMRNGGFFAESMKPGSGFEREPIPSKKPVIDLDALEGTK